MSGLKKLIVEIHRRSLWQVVLIYIGGAWGCYEIIDTVTDRLALPAWLPVFAIILFLLGLPFVVATAFVREETAAASAPDAPGPDVSGGGPVPDTVRRAKARTESERLAARRRLLTWRNLGFAFVGVLAVWGAAAAGWLILGSPVEVERPALEASDISAARVAVLPFSVRGSEEVAYLGEGMVDLLSTALDGAGALRVVDPYALMKFLSNRRDRELDPETGEAVAGRFGAGRFVLGSIVEAGGRLQINAALYTADGGVEITAEEVAEDESQVFDLVNRVARELLAGGLGAANARLTRVAAATTDSLAALKAYLEGESALRTGQFRDAAAAFQRAIEVDSSFALGWYRLALATIYSPTPTGFRSARAAAEAVRLGARLSPRDRDRLAVLDAFLRGALHEGEQRARAILRSYPEDLEAWYYLGEFFFHFGALEGGSINEATQAYQRALQYDPDHFQSRAHLSWTLSIEHRYDELERELERMVNFERGSDIPLFSRPILSFLRDGRSVVDELLPQLRSAPAFTLSFVSFRLALLDDGLPAAVDVARLLTDPSRTDGEHQNGYLLQAYFEAAQGHLRAAEQALHGLESVPVMTPLYTPLEVRGSLWTSPFVPVVETELESLRRELAGLDYDTVYAPVTRAYLLSLVNGRLGDEGQARRYADQLERRAAAADAAEPSNVESWAAYFAGIARAQLAVQAGEVEEALRQLERVEPEARWALPARTLPMALEHERYLRALALEAAGRDEDALRWYESLGWWHSGIPYTAPALLRRAAIHERLGQPEAAVDCYRQFLARWREPDPELQSRVDEARRALARLTGAERSP